MLRMIKQNWKNYSEKSISERRD